MGSNEHTYRRSNTADRRRLALLVATGLIAALLGFQASAPAAAQTGQQSLTADPSSVPGAGTYDFTLTPTGFTSSATNLAVCGTGDSSLITDAARLMQYCGGFGSFQDATSGPFMVKDVEVGAAGVTFLLFEIVADGESASVSVNTGDGNGDEDGDVTFSGTVTAPSGMSTEDVVVSVVAEWCWDSCESAVLDNDDPRRPRLLNPVAFLGETGVDSSGMWSVTVSGVQSYDIGNVMLMVWDRNAELAISSIDGLDYPELWDWESLSGIDVELQAGGQVSGRFATLSGGPLPTGRYVLISSPSFGYDLHVDLETGDFISPAVAPGDYGIAHGDHSGGYLTNNNAAQITITGGQTAQLAQPVQLLQTGGLTGTVSDTAGRTLDGVRVRGEISSQSSPYHSMIPSPFGLNGATWFEATTDEDGTYTARNIIPSDWQVTFGVPSPAHYTAIAAGYAHSCALRADQTIACWGGNGSGQADAPEGKYTAIAAGYAHSCALRADQTIACWGGNYDGQTDAPAGKYTAIAASWHYSCAIAADQTITCWGDNSSWQADAPEGKYTAIAAGRSHSCAIAADQTITCWGNNSHEQANPPEGKYTAIAAGYNNSCAIRADQTITCWGFNGYGKADPPEGKYTAIAAGDSHLCAFRADQTITCWGNNGSGQADAPEGKYTAIAAGSEHSCALRADQTITCWGTNSSRQANPGPPATVTATVSSGRTTTGVDYPITDDTDTKDTDDGDTGDDATAQQCFAAHKFGAQPVDVAKTADGQTVLAQLNWGHHESIGCYLALDTAATAALRAAHT